MRTIAVLLACCLVLASVVAQELSGQELAGGFDGHQLSRSLSRSKRKALLFPIQTTLQVSMCTATDGRLFAPPKKYPWRKLGINLGFQQNFNLPFRLLEFYKPATWARAIAGIIKGYFPATTVVTARGQKRSTDHQSLALTAGQLYLFTEDFLQVFGYDKHCLLRSVCELAHSPFERAELEQDLITEVVHLLLSPSVHDAFADDERELRRAYEMAERLGASGANCELIYDRCHRSVLSDFSNLIDDSPTRR